MLDGVSPSRFLRIVSEGNYTVLKRLYGQSRCRSCCLENKNEAGTCGVHIKITFIDLPVRITTQQTTQLEIKEPCEQLKQGQKSCLFSSVNLGNATKMSAQIWPLPPTDVVKRKQEEPELSLCHLQPRYLLNSPKSPEIQQPNQLLPLVKTERGMDEERRVCDSERWTAGKTAGSAEGERARP